MRDVIEVLKSGGLDSKHSVHYTPRTLVIANEEVHIISVCLFYIRSPL